MVLAGLGAFSFAVGRVVAGRTTIILMTSFRRREEGPEAPRGAQRRPRVKSYRTTARNERKRRDEAVRSRGPLRTATPHVKAMRHLKRLHAQNHTATFSLRAALRQCMHIGWGPAVESCSIWVLSVEVLAHLASELLLRDNAAASCHASAPHSLWSLVTAWRRGSSLAKSRSPRWG